MKRIYSTECMLLPVNWLFIHTIEVKVILSQPKSRCNQPRPRPLQWGALDWSRPHPPMLRPSCQPECWLHCHTQNSTQWQCTCLACSEWAWHLYACGHQENQDLECAQERQWCSLSHFLECHMWAPMCRQDWRTLTLEWVNIETLILPVQATFLHLLFQSAALRVVGCDDTIILIFCL